MRPGQVDSCACGVQYIGATNQRTGNVAPIVTAPDPTGNCLLWRAHDRTPIYVVIGRPEIRDYLRELGVPLRLNHFADCPQAARFR